MAFTANNVGFRVKRPGVGPVDFTPPHQDFGNYTGQGGVLTPTQMAARDKFQLFAAGMARAGKVVDATSAHNPSGQQFLTGLSPADPSRRMGLIASGAPGVGKTHLVHAALRAVAKDACRKTLAVAGNRHHLPPISPAATEILDEARLLFSEPLTLGKLTELLENENQHVYLALALLLPLLNLGSVVNPRVKSSYEGNDKTEIDPFHKAVFDACVRWEQILVDHTLSALQLLYGVDAVANAADRLRAISSFIRVEGGLTDEKDLSRSEGSYDHGGPRGYPIKLDGNLLCVTLFGPNTRDGLLVTVRAGRTLPNKIAIQTAEPIQPWMVSANPSVAFRAETNPFIIHLVGPFGASELLDVANAMKTGAHHLVVLDDLFCHEAGTNTPPTQETVAALVSVIHAVSESGARLMITTNMPLDDLLGYLPQSTLSRVRNRMALLEIEGPDGREYTASEEDGGF